MTRLEKKEKGINKKKKKFCVDIVNRLILYLGAKGLHLRYLR